MPSKTAPARPDPALQSRLWNLPGMSAQELFETLKAGADPHVPNPEDDRTPLRFLVEEGMDEPATTIEYMDILLNQGANPLLVDAALVGALAEEDKIMVQGMAEKCVEMDYTSESGENVFHVLCECSRSYGQLDAAYSIVHLAEQYEKLHQVNAFDDHGDTPLHTLWKNSNSIGWVLHPQKQNRREDPDEIDTQWMMTDVLVRAGGDLHAKDTQGQTVEQVIRQQMEAGFPEPAEDSEAREFYATLCASWMEQATPAALGRGQKPRM